MKKTIPVFAAIACMLFVLQPVFAQDPPGGVAHTGKWYVGEGLKNGDFFSYEVCSVVYKDCTKFQMDLWIEDEVLINNETQWLVQTLVYDGTKTVSGNITLGQVDTKPTGGSLDSEYRNAFGSSVTWLSAFASAQETKNFADVSWGKIATISGEQVKPKVILPNGLTVDAGHFDEVIQIGWRTGGYNSDIFVVDDFPFPVMASTFTQVSAGIPPQEYKFELLEYREDILDNPFEEIITNDPRLQQDLTGCPDNEMLHALLKKPTKNFAYQVHVFYGPEFPVDQCPMKMQIKFLSKFDDKEFLNQVWYDVLALDKDGFEQRSLAAEEGRNNLFSQSGQALLEFTVNEGPGTANYAIVIYGMSIPNVTPSDAPDYLDVPIIISARQNAADLSSVSDEMQVPSWIKTSVKFWVLGDTSDGEFVSAIQFLINKGIIIVPATISDDPAGDDSVPTWFKITTGYWVDDAVSDGEFVNAIQHLVKTGIITLS